MTSPGRGDLGAIDNETLDFMQLEDYINEDNENTIYFHEALVGGELKLAEPGKDQVYVSGNGRTGGTRTDASSPLTTHLNSVNSDPSPSLVHAVSSSSLHSSPVAVSTTVGKTETFRSRNSIAGSSFSKPHHLPDSPPDSGSEPPFSPPNEDPKLNSASAPPEMLQQAPLDTLKHYMSYGHTQPLKHLPEVSTSAHHLTHVAAVPVTVQSPHSTSLPLLTVGQPHSPAGQLLTQLPQNILAPLVGSNLQQQQALVAPGGHLGNLYGSGEEFLYDNLASPTSTSSASKKRKLSDSPKSSRSYINGIVHVKTEPAVNSPDPVHSSSVLPSGDEDYSFDLGSADSAGLFLDANYQCIRFQPFQQNTWVQLLDRDMKEIPPPNFRVDADKGFNYSNADESFVCQKKNHFQVTVHVQPVCEAHYIRTPEGTKPIEKFTLDFHGVKMESPTQTIKVEQSQSDRSKKPFHPVPLQLVTDQVTKTTVGRLHFSETTSNNMRKKGKPNPDQRFFFLVVSLCVHVSGDVSYPVVSHASEKIIVRASNPGQFENDMELTWQKGHTSDSIFHAGRVGINTDRPEESLVVHGNIKVTGHIVQPSDLRAKVDIQELDTREQLKNVASMRIVRYKYLPEFGHHVGVTQLSDTGVIAQEVQHILPEAVLEAGDIRLSDGRLIDKLLVVNKERIFMENVGAVKELCKVTDNLENRIDELERINRKLSSMKRKDSWKSTSTDISRSSNNSTSYSKKNRSRQTKSRFSNSMACSSRFVQATIVILVLVMAFCLVSMATLYIMEWRNRHSTPQFQKVSTFATKSTYSINSSSKKNEHVGSSPTVLPYSGSSFTVTVSLPNADIDGSTIDEVSTSHSGYGPSSTLQPSENPDAVLGEPAGCSLLDPCPVFCCESHNRLVLEEMDALGTSLNHQNHVDRKRSGPLSTHGESYTEDSRSTGSTDTVLPSTPAVLGDHGKANKGSEEAERRSNLIERIRRIHKRGLPDNSQFQKPDAAKEESIIPLVHLVELNVTLTSDMCIKQPHGVSSGRFTCQVKLSRHFPMSNITLQISLLNQMNAELCEGTEDQTCSQQNVLDQKSVSEVRKREVIPQVHSWELPAGLHFKSSYRFRIISWNLLPTDSHPCNLHEDQHAFTEYVIKFQRQCDK